MYIQGSVYIRNATGVIKMRYGMFSYRKPAINPPTFDGRVNFSLFKQLFEEAMTLNDWQSQKKIAVWLRISLKGQACDIVYENCYAISELWHRLDMR